MDIIYYIRIKASNSLMSQVTPIGETGKRSHGKKMEVTTFYENAKCGHKESGKSNDLIWEKAEK